MPEDARSRHERLFNPKKYYGGSNESQAFEEGRAVLIKDGNGVRYQLKRHSFGTPRRDNKEDT